MSCDWRRGSQTNVVAHLQNDLDELEKEFIGLFDRSPVTLP